ncbi:helix-turn-helix domain-containing protein [Herbiconiux sp. A18JL235]|uniref:Helix-turn-helix domain-containing protein n=1 Tax=Herbiconiux sp. A18JL235 TaxID=3152363 RepID=A0AB39BBD0_9MICO
MPRWAPDAALRLERAAMELFASKGYAQTTVPEIAGRAGLTTRTFFRHFADKRDVLFLRERELPSVVADVLVAAPVGLSPMDLAFHGLDAVASGDLEGWKREVGARRAVIEQEPKLRERERLKSAVLTDAIDVALRARGASREEASLVAAVAAALFDTALSEWLAGDDAVPLADVLQRQRELLVRLTASAGSATPTTPGPEGR